MAITSLAVSENVDEVDRLQRFGSDGGDPDVSAKLLLIVLAIHLVSREKIRSLRLIRTPTAAS